MVACSAQVAQKSASSMAIFSAFGSEIAFPSRTLRFQLRHLFIPQRKRNFWHFGRRRVGCGALRTPTIAEEECGRGARPGDDVSSAATATNRAGARCRELPAARCTASSITGECKPREGGMGRNKFVDIRAPCRPRGRPLVVTALSLCSLLFPFFARNRNPRHEHELVAAL